MGQETRAKTGDDGLSVFLPRSDQTQRGAREEVRFHRCLGGRYRYSSASRRPLGRSKKFGSGTHHEARVGGFVGSDPHAVPTGTPKLPVSVYHLNLRAALGFTPGVHEAQVAARATVCRVALVAVCDVDLVAAFAPAHLVAVVSVLAGQN